jgi:hypothetical protein
MGYRSIGSMDVEVEKRIFCPKCGWSNVRSSKEAGFLDGAAKLFFLAPLRCRSCRLRFYRPWFVAKRASPVITVHHPIRTSAAFPQGSLSSKM